MFFNVNNKQKFPEYKWNAHVMIPLINFKILLHIGIAINKRTYRDLTKEYSCIADAIDTIQDYVVVKSVMDIVLQYEGQLLFDFCFWWFFLLYV